MVDFVFSTANAIKELEAIEETKRFGKRMWVRKWNLVENNWVHCKRY